MTKEEKQCEVCGMILDRRTFLKAAGLALAGIPAAINAAPRPVKIYRGGVIDIKYIPHILQPPGEAILPRVIHAQGTSLKFDGVEVFPRQPEPGFRYYVGLHNLPPELLFPCHKS